MSLRGAKRRGNLAAKCYEFAENQCENVPILRDRHGRKAEIGTACKRDNLPDLTSDYFYDVTSLSDDSEYCKKYTASIYRDKTAIIRSLYGYTLNCSYEISRIQEDYIFGAVYYNDRSIGYFYIYRNDEQSAEMRYTLKIKVHTYRKYFLHLLFVVFHYRLSSAEINSIMFLCSTPSRFWSRVSIVSRYLG